MSERLSAALLVFALACAACIALAIAVAPLMRAASERVAERARIEREQWEARRAEYAQRQRELTQAIVDAARIALYAVATLSAACALACAVYVGRWAVTAPVARRIDRIRPTITVSAIYDPLTGGVIWLDREHPHDPDLLPARGVALARGGEGEPTRAEIVRNCWDGRD